MDVSLEEQSMDTIPRSQAFADVYDEMLDLAPEYLDENVSVEVDAWMDGSFRVVVFHWRGEDEREALYYHSDEGVVRYGVETDEELKVDRSVTAIEPG